MPTLQVLISVINYANEQEVLEHLTHLAKQTAKDQLAVAVVGNKWSPDGKRMLQEGLQAIEIDAHIYDPGKNLGYLNGTLYGYQEYVKETGKTPRWVAVSNTDISYATEDFYQKFIARDYAKDIGCVAPSVYVPATGAYENPRYSCRFSLADMEKRIRVFQSNTISAVYQRLSALKAGLRRSGKQESQYTYWVHGCFFLVRNDLAKALCDQPFGTLLYSEEAYVSEMAIQIGVREYYDGDLEVFHHENAVTGKLHNAARAKMYVDSISMIRDRFYARGPVERLYTKKDVCSVIVSYNGPDKLRDNIRALQQQVDRIVVVDNGSTDRVLQQLQELQREIPFELIINENNMGIGTALQQGLAYAWERGYELLLTMDQDSRMDQDAVEAMINVLNRHASVAAVGPEYGPSPDLDRLQKEAYSVQYLITSGNLIRVKPTYCAGGYNEALFIDSVDFDFSLMLRRNGYEIMRVPKAFMYHGIGEKTPVKTCFGTIHLWTHAPVRYYYIIRNHKYLCKTYAGQFKLFCFKKRLSMMYQTAEVLLLHPNRKENLAMMHRGWNDARRGKYGKYIP